MNRASILIWLVLGTFLAYIATISIRMIMGGETAQRTFSFVIGAKRYRSLQSKGLVITDRTLRFTGAGLLIFVLLFLWSIGRQFIP